MGNQFLTFSKMAKALQKKFEQKYGNSYLKSAFGINFGLWEVVKWKIRKCMYLRIFRLTTSQSQQLIQKADLKWECPYIHSKFVFLRVSANIKKCQKNDFPLYFKIVILRWPKVFKEIDHGCFRAPGPYFIGKSPCTT